MRRRDLGRAALQTKVHHCNLREPSGGGEKGGALGLWGSVVAVARLATERGPSRDCCSPVLAHYTHATPRPRTCVRPSLLLPAPGDIFALSAPITLPSYPPTPSASSPDLRPWWIVPGFAVFSHGNLNHRLSPCHELINQSINKPCFDLLCFAVPCAALPLLSDEIRPLGLTRTDTCAPGSLFFTTNGQYLPSPFCRMRCHSNRQRASWT